MKSSTSFLNRATFLVVSLLLLSGVPIQARDSSARSELTVNYKIHEEVPAKTYIGNVIQDANMTSTYDPNHIGQIRFRLVKPAADTPDYFTIDHASGSIETGQARLDREAICRYAAVCQISYKVQLRQLDVKLIDVINVNFLVLDSNDNEPRFSSAHYILNISENAQLQSTIYLPTAEDFDSPIYSVSTYNITPFRPGPQNPFAFRVDSSSRRPQLILTRPLDREKQNVYYATLSAIDGGKPPKTGTIQIEVRVVDVNDNPPIFDRTNYAVSVREDLPVGSTVIKVNAVDADEGANGEVTYRIARGGTHGLEKIFELNAKTGEVVLISPLDYEEKTSYEINIEAQDMAEPFQYASTSVKIKVEDVNDNQPQILLTSGTSLSLPENSPIGTYVDRVMISDPDSGKGGQFSCHVGDGDDESREFELKNVRNSIYEIVTKSELDRETKATHALKIVCEDLGEPPQRAEEFVTVTVEDVNDCTPTFEEATYNANIFENNFIGSNVIKVKAHDCDEGDNSRITYKLLSMLEYFAIDKDTGQITTAVILDREIVGDILNFTVSAVDAGQPARSSTARVRVVVDDVNDNKPLFDVQSYQFNISENVPSPAFVGWVKASDNDRLHSDNAKISYSILPGLSSQFFHISDDSGVISTTKVLDREQTSVHYVVVCASDGGKPSLSSTVGVTILVDDRNDNAPTFEFPPNENTSIQLSTRASKGYEVARFRAVDFDSGLNGKVIYGMDNETLSERGLPGLFELDPVRGILILSAGDVRSMNGLIVAVKIWAEDGAIEPDARQRTETMVRVVFNVSAPIMINGHLIDGSSWLLAMGLYDNGPQTIIIVAASALGALITVATVLIVFCIRRKRTLHQKMKNQDTSAQHYNCRTASLKAFSPVPASLMMHSDLASDVECGRSSSYDELDAPLNHESKTYDPNWNAESRSLLNNYPKPDNNVRTVDRLRTPPQRHRNNIYSTQPVKNFSTYCPTVSQYCSPVETASPNRCSITSEPPQYQPYPYAVGGRDFEVVRHPDNNLRSSLSQRPSSQPLPQVHGRVMTRIDKEAKHLLDILKEDSVLESLSLSSNQEANSDSGKGASEEGGDGRATATSVDNCSFHNSSNRFSTGGSSVAASCCFNAANQQHPPFSGAHGSPHHHHHLPHNSSLHSTPIQVTSTPQPSSSSSSSSPSRYTSTSCNPHPFRCPVSGMGFGGPLKSPVYESKFKRNSGEIRYSVNQDYIRYKPLSPNNATDHFGPAPAAKDDVTTSRGDSYLTSGAVAMNLLASGQKARPLAKNENRSAFLNVPGGHLRTAAGGVTYKLLHRGSDGRQAYSNQLSHSSCTDEDDAVSSTSGSYVVEQRDKS